MEKTIFILNWHDIIPEFTAQDLAKDTSHLQSKIENYEKLTTLLENIASDQHYIAIIMPNKEYEIDGMKKVFDSLFPNISQKDFFDEFDIDRIIKSFNTKNSLFEIKKSDFNRIVIISDKKYHAKFTQLNIDREKYIDMKEEAEAMENLIYPMHPKKKNLFQRHKVKFTMASIIAAIIIGVALGIILQITQQVSFPGDMIGAAVLGGAAGFTITIPTMGGFYLVKRCTDYHKPMFSDAEDLHVENSTLLSRHSIPKNYETNVDHSFSPPIPGFKHLLAANKNQAAAKPEVADSTIILNMDMKEEQGFNTGPNNV